MVGFLWAAAAMAALTFAVHTFVGGRVVARPLLADKTLPKASKWLNYYGWHVTTVAIVFVAAGFAWTAFGSRDALLVAFLSALTASLSALSVWVAIKGGIHPLRFPSTTLFAATSAFGYAALFF